MTAQTIDLPMGHDMPFDGGPEELVRRQRQASLSSSSSRRSTRREAVRPPPRQRRRARRGSKSRSVIILLARRRASPPQEEGQGGGAAVTAGQILRPVQDAMDEEATRTTPSRPCTSRTLPRSKRPSRQWKPAKRGEHLGGSPKRYPGGVRPGKGGCGDLGV